MELRRYGLDVDSKILCGLLMSPADALNLGSTREDKIPLIRSRLFLTQYETSIKSQG